MSLSQAAPRPSGVRDLTSLLDLLERRCAAMPGQDVSVGEVMTLIGARAYGPLLLIIGLISISPVTLIPGSTWAFATLTLVIALQLALHREKPWMPRRALAMTLSERRLTQFVRAARPTARVIDRIIRPRLEFLAERPWVIGTALVVALAALITFPLGFIPIAPVLPGLAIALFGLGVTARDGLLLLIGAALVSGGAWLVLSRLF
jgi:hypothetical protein